MLRTLFGFLLLYLLARIVIGLFRGFLPRKPGGNGPAAPAPEEKPPLREADIEDADWEEIEDSKGDSG